MDRDPSENVVDPVKRVSPSTGNNDTGEVGDEQARLYKKRQSRGQEPKSDPTVHAPEGDQAPGRDHDN